MHLITSPPYRSDKRISKNLQNIYERNHIRIVIRLDILSSHGILQHTSFPCRLHFPIYTKVIVRWQFLFVFVCFFSCPMAITSSPVSLHNQDNLALPLNSTVISQFPSHRGSTQGKGAFWANLNQSNPIQSNPSILWIWYEADQSRKIQEHLSKACPGFPIVKESVSIQHGWLSCPPAQHWTTSSRKLKGTHWNLISDTF